MGTWEGICGDRVRSFCFPTQCGYVDPVRNPAWLPRALSRSFTLRTVCGTVEPPTSAKSIMVTVAFVKNPQMFANLDEDRTLTYTQ